MEEQVEDLFDKASNYVRSIAGSGRLDSDTLLYLYSRYKQFTEGPCNTQRPGFFDFQGKQKWDAWNKLGNQTKIQSAQEYIDKLYNADPDWLEKLEYDSDIEPESKGTGMGIGVSTMSAEEDSIADEDKDVFDWCKEGNLEQVKKILTDSKDDYVNKRDEEGMCLLHWACDRGHNEMVKHLLEFNANVNAQDAEGQTALHYAVSCEHKEVVEILLASGADPSIADMDDMTPAETTENAQILELLQSI